MKTKHLLITLTTVVVVAALAWAGTFLYWHYRITAAMKVMEAKLPQQIFTSLSWPPDLLEAEQVLIAAGCRALPYHVRAVDGARDRRILDYTIHAVIGRVSAGPANEELRKRFVVELVDSPAVRRQKCDRLKAWWSENGSGYHQWWRVWSSHCSE